MITYIMFHLILGVIGAVIVARLELNQGLDYTLNDLVVSILAATVLGPFCFVLAILYSFGEPSRVLFKGEKK
jgi:lipopolysaccharide/colanic/teichoic acid biosynthesis glycosyltransferase